MKPDPEYLRRHYAALSDSALTRLAAEDLVAEARTLLDDELARRKLAGPEEERSEDAEEYDEDYSFDPAGQEEPDWLEEAGCACTFADEPSRPAAPVAAHAREVLLEAGIPCFLAVEPVRAAESRERRHDTAMEYRLMVPGKRTLEATSVLDRDYFNEDIEAKWRSHFEDLSEEEFREIDLEAMLAGYVDLVERLRRAHGEEVERRKGRR